jgi:predicted outer membrane repeat protein
MAGILDDGRLQGTTFTVTTAADVVDAGDGVLSLREAVAAANATAAADTILFANPLEGQTLTLTQGQLTLRADVTIDGDRDDNGSAVTIDGGGNSRVLMIGSDGTEVALTDLTVTGGNERRADGGGIFLGAGNGLSLTGCTIADNSVGSFEPDDGGYYQGGGGIFADAGSRLTVADSVFFGNGALGRGGAIAGAANVSLVVRDSEFLSNGSYFTGGAIWLSGGSLVMTDCLAQGNSSENNGGGAILLGGSTARIERSTIADGTTNEGAPGAGILAIRSAVTLIGSTLAGNYALGGGAAIYAVQESELVLRDTTVTGNVSAAGSGAIFATGRLEIANSIVAGNSSDVVGAITASNGHNVFGSDVAGDVAGDLENVAAARLFASIDPETGGGRLARNGGPTPTVRLRDALDNPALSGADPLDAGGTDQRGVARPLPGDSNPDIGSFELNQIAISRSASAHNDVLAGTGGADTLVALAGNDLVRGLGGNDDLRGVGGSDTLAGGVGRDRLDGGSGRDLLLGETGNDLLLGGFNADALFGGSGADVLRGQFGTDRLRGGSGGDRFDFDPGDSGVGADRRDLILDFARGADRIDLATIDANAGLMGDQAFAFLGIGALTGAGQLRYGFAGTSTVVQASTDGDAAPEFEIQLVGRITLTAQDFLL